MANRREFLQSAAALSAAPLAGRAFAGNGASAVPDVVIIDARYREASTFGNYAASLGAPLRAIQGDITELWKDELLARWKSARPGLVAGLTERPALFLLERLAWDHGLRVVYETEHDLSARGPGRHSVVRSADSRLENDLRAAGANWPGVLADAMVAGRRAHSRDYRPTGAAMAAHRLEAGMLYSWIIAPRDA